MSGKKKKKEPKKPACFTLTKSTVERTRQMGVDLDRNLSQQVEKNLRDAVDNHESNQNK